MPVTETIWKVRSVN